MQRSRLRNIINLSKGLSNKKESVGDPYDEFIKTLPKELLQDANYRMQAAWKAYGSPKDYKQALWEGMIQPIDENTYKLPSIGYNEETDEYEYLNKGRENETVAKDIRVWDNDVIPFVQELKHGGYVRTFNEAKDCWTYSKNSQKEDTLDKEQINIQKEPSEENIDYLKQGGKTKPPYYEWYKSLPEDKRNDEDYDLARAFYELPLEELEKFRNNLEYHLSGDYKKPNHPTYSDEGYGWKGSDEKGWIFTVSPRQQTLHDFNWYKNYWDKYEPNSKLIYNGEQYTANPVNSFKQGGQMSVIPEGALHAHKNHMEGAGEDFTAKGIPVVDNKGEQQAEIERNEIIFRKEVTDKIEKLFKKYKEEDSKDKKDSIAIEMGKILTCEITKHTEDRTGLIEEVEQKM